MPAGVRFDPNKLIWLGSTNRETQLSYIWHTVPVDTLEDVGARELIVGAQAPGSTQYDYPMLVNHAPNVPAARVETLRRAFDATMKDPVFLAEAGRLKIDSDPLAGEQVAALVEQVSRTPADTVARVRAALENK
jgi:hypothetical protein